GGGAPGRGKETDPLERKYEDQRREAAGGAGKSQPGPVIVAPDRAGTGWRRCARRLAARRRGTGRGCTRARRWLRFRWCFSLWLGGGRLGLCGNRLRRQVDRNWRALTALARPPFAASPGVLGFVLAGHALPRRAPAARCR